MIKTTRPLALVAVLVLIGISLFAIQATKNTASADIQNQSASHAFLADTEKQGFTPAPELNDISGYLNAPENFTLSSVKGKVILVDFWTYSCINCIRTLPYLKNWHEKYKDQGLAVVGVHTPEFQFEKDLQNVQAAVQQNGISYPVVLDNDYATWRAYQNNYWPHKYLIDAQGYIRYDHIGEGGYEETERQIRKLLMERDEQLQLEPTQTANATPLPLGQIGTPEIYFGYDFIRQPFGNLAELKTEEPIAFTFNGVDQFTPNLAYLEGTWVIRKDHAELVSDSGRVALAFKAKTANIVAGSNPPQPVTAMVFGLPEKTVAIHRQTLYPVAETPDYEQKTLVLTASKGFQLYTFTFG
ncbi:redoxin domain-containing protein [Candidatus Micrarchaeota archaeon]|nr:redoxin domain-containing protein [Candidatus Micrarchaeota archaeon]